MSLVTYYIVDNRLGRPLDRSVQAQRSRARRATALLASALCGASLFPLVRVLHNREYAECSANGAGRRHDSVRVKERRGRERRWRSVPCVAHCAPPLLLSSTAPRICSERGPFVENRSNGDKQDDQCSWTGREDIALGKLAAWCSCCVVQLWSHPQLSFLSPSLPLFVLVRSILSCDVR